MLRNHGQVGGAAKRPSEDSTESTANIKRRRLERDDDPAQYYNMLKVSEKKIEKFNTSASYYKISFNDLEVTGLGEILKTLKIIFQSIIDRATQEISSSDLVRVSVDNPELDFPIVLPFMKRSAFTVNRLLSEIERVLQSYEQFVLDESIGIELVHVHIPSGRGFKKQPFVDLHKLLHNKRSIIQIRNSDEICCARAIVTAIAREEKHPGCQFKGNLLKAFINEQGFQYMSAG